MPEAWVDPLALAKTVDSAGEPYVLLHSAMADASGRQRSILAFEPLETLRGEDFDALAARLTHDRPCLENAWFGYLAYDLVHALERLRPEVPARWELPRVWMTRFRRIVVFDHVAGTVTTHGSGALPTPSTVDIRTLPHAHLRGADRTGEAFRNDVEETRDAIARGDFFQCNVTRKFFGVCAPETNRVDLFARLAKASPAPYMALMRTGEVDIVSSSPEQFLQVTPQGRVTTRPIKGSAPRHPDPREDRRLREMLLASPKERAENLMIVDLMRNDLARGCAVGSIRVDALYETDSYATIHHLSSSVSGLRRPDATTLEVVKGCFPPGSMTGAPKLAAIGHARRHEPLPRGIYSGALGWFGGDGSADLSVVIRTLLMRYGAFEFQTGAGIVYDSDSTAEWRETLIKARGLCLALGIDPRTLERY